MVANQFCLQIAGIVRILAIRRPQQIWLPKCWSSPRQRYSCDCTTPCEINHFLQKLVREQGTHSQRKACTPDVYSSTASSSFRLNKDYA